MQECHVRKNDRLCVHHMRSAYIVCYDWRDSIMGFDGIVIPATFSVEGERKTYMGK